MNAEVAFMPRLPKSNSLSIKHSSLTAWANRRIFGAIFPLEAAGFRRRLFVKVPNHDLSRVLGILELLCTQVEIHRVAQAERVGGRLSSVPGDEGHDTSP